MKVQKDSPPLVDAGTPLVGHYRNKDIPKAVLYTILFVTSLTGTILFAPTSSEGSLLRIDESISNPLFYSFIGGSLSSLIASSVDTAVTYQIYNNKLLTMNEIHFIPNLQSQIDKRTFENLILQEIRTGKQRKILLDIYHLDLVKEKYLLKPDLTKTEIRNGRWLLTVAGFQSNTKYDAIVEYREQAALLKQEEQKALQMQELEGEITYYREKLLKGTITQEELYFIEQSEQFKEILKNELGYYYIKQEEKSADSLK
ncbi:MAG: hypothetical protein MJB14_03965 [Spirochaetes bacterium]|nr:hypothetical protein [Spirochaetota bacterium]